MSLGTSPHISVGDLVQVIKPSTCCGYATSGIGEIFRVAVIRPRNGKCPNCGAWPGDIKAMADHHQMGYDTTRLKRIPPLSELEGEKRDEEITA